MEYKSEATSGLYLKSHYIFGPSILFDSKIDSLSKLEVKFDIIVPSPVRMNE